MGAAAVAPVWSWGTCSRSSLQGRSESGHAPLSVHRAWRRREGAWRRQLDVGPAVQRSVCLGNRNGHDVTETVIEAMELVGRGSRPGSRET